MCHAHAQPSGYGSSSTERWTIAYQHGCNYVLDDIAYHDYEGPSLYLDERSRLQSSLGKKEP
ncbi:MAG: hypothetical protein CM1200mP18_12850 [Gammaproteobacteria bacterium]|nr:MAG: hypothetical protein CM1200mP18_12850 [Gammaproteobacteria bacterium]